MFKKRWTLFFAIIVLIGCTACAESVTLSQRGIVKGIYAEWKDANYQVGLVLIQGLEDEKPEVTLSYGKGETLAQALQKAEQSNDSTVFYGQNQLLFVGENASSKKLGEILDYFSTEQSNRPNMAVYVTKENLDKFKDWSEEKDFFQQLNFLEKDLETNKKQARMIYELNQGGDQAEGLVPLLDKKDTVKTDQLVLYKDNQPIELLNQSESQLARLLLGNPVTLEFLKEYQGETLRYTVDSPHISYHIQVENEKPVLEIQLKGTVRAIIAGTAQHQAELSSWKQRKELSKVFSAQITQEIQNLFEKTWNKQTDPFGLSWWFGLWNSKWYQTHYPNGELWKYDSIKINTQIKVV